MKKFAILLIALVCPILFSCNSNTSTTEDKTSTNVDSKNDELYFDFSIDGKEFHLTEADILTSYNEFGADKEFKIFAGKDEGPNLILNLVSDMSKSSNTPNGTPESSGKLGQGSVSLQNYPVKGLTFNSYDYLLDPKPAVIADAIVITNSDKVEDKGRIITGTINVIVRGGENKQNDPAIKDYVIKGKFRIMHAFTGLSF